jgi:hypothetical protein
VRDLLRSWEREGTLSPYTYIDRVPCRFGKTEQTMRVVILAQRDSRVKKSQGARGWWAEKTEEERSEILRERSRKAWETRRRDGTKQEVGGMRIRKWVVRSPEAAYELYCDLYEKRFRRKLKGKALQSTVKGNLGHLVARVGGEEALLAVRVIMTSPKLKWVTSPPDAFLANETTYERHVGPLLHEPTHASGEQAEWSGSRDGKSGAVSSGEFFGR